ncbi:MAG: hypothetical protein P8181_12445 [bacterium]
MKTTANGMLLVIVIAVALTAVSQTTSNAGVRVEVAYGSAPANVQVWIGSVYDPVERCCGDYYDGAHGYDVFPSQNDIVLYVRPSRSCYAAVYVIDTEGFVHVLHPLSPADDAYLVGGRVYRYRLRDFAFYGPCFDRGVAYAFAVGSPVPFNYGYYDAGIFGSRIGFRIYGDPFVASRLFYVSLLPRACAWNLVGVGYARFYVREYRRYPRYLCAGWHDDHGARTYCRGNCGAFHEYRLHAADPYQVIQPQREFRPEVSRLARIDRATPKDMQDIRVVASSGGKSVEPRVERQTKTVVKTTDARTVQSFPLRRTVNRAQEGNVDRGSTKPPVDKRTVPGVSKGAAAAHVSSSERIVLSTRNSFVKSKADFTKMRERLENKNTANRGVQKTGSGKTADVRGSSKKSGDTQAKAGASAKRTKK